jgi:hypothetical protein
MLCPYRICPCCGVPLEHQRGRAPRSIADRNVDPFWRPESEPVPGIDVAGAPASGDGGVGPVSGKPVDYRRPTTPWIGELSAMPPPVPSDELAQEISELRRRVALAKRGHPSNHMSNQDDQ